MLSRSYDHIQHRSHDDVITRAAVVGCVPELQREDISDMPATVLYGSTAAVVRSYCSVLRQDGY